MTNTTSVPAYTYAVCAAAVAKGAAYMTQAHPGWMALIDRGDLDMADCGLCVWGQVELKTTDDPEAGFETMHRLHPDTDERMTWTAAHGFDIPEGNDNEADMRYAMLKCAWLEYIEEHTTWL